MDAWKNTLWSKLLEKYSPDDIYTADEIGLFYNRQPNKSLVFNDEDGRGGKCSNSRITLMPVANISGTHKLKPAGINNCLKLHIFSQKRINVQVAWSKVIPATINCFSHCGFVAPASASASAPEDYDDPDDDIPLAQLIKSLWCAGMEVCSEDGIVDDNLLTAVPMTVQDIAKEALDNKAAKDPENDIPDEEEEDSAPPPTPKYIKLPLAC